MILDIIKLKIGIFDINHGALEIAKKLKDMGYLVTVFDVYECNRNKKKENNYKNDKYIKISNDITDIQNQN